MVEIQDEVTNTKTTTHIDAGDIPTSYGKLTLTGPQVLLPELLITRCACGLPGVLVMASAWTTPQSPLGCSVCHRKEAEEREQKAQRDAEQSAAVARAQRHEAHLRDINVTPHYFDLDAKQRKVFQHIVTAGSTDVAQLASILGCSAPEAWEMIGALLQHNVLLERRGWDGTVRPYNVDETYGIRALPESRYVARPSAVKQMNAAQDAATAEGSARKAQVAPRAVEPAALTPEAASAVDRATIEELRDWVDARCERSGTVSAAILRSRYWAFHEELGLTAPTPEEFEAALAALGFARRGDKYVGLRLKLLRDLNQDAAITEAAATATI
jgi:hypothetical protein